MCPHSKPSVASVADLRRRYVNCQDWDTGGGCMALQHPCDDRGYLLITDCAGERIPADDATEIYVGRYAANGDTVEEARVIPIGEAQSWIDAALSRARDPKTIADYFVRKLGAAPVDDTLRELPLESSCGQECVKAIDAAAALLDHVHAAYGSTQTGQPTDRAEEEVIEVARRIIGVYWRG